jgi:hypothetical protein
MSLLENILKIKTNKVARWPHGCRRQCSEVAVLALVSSNLTEGGGFFPPLGHGGLPTTTARSAGFKSRPDGPPMDVSCCVRIVEKGEERVAGESTPEPCRTTQGKKRGSKKTIKPTARYLIGQEW